MANEDREIVLRLLVDGQEAIATIKLTDEQVKKLKKTASEVDDKFIQAYQNITKELLKFNTVNDESIEAITKWLATQNLTEEVMDGTISRLEAESRQLNLNSQEWKNNQTASTNLQGAYSKLIQQNMSLGSTQNTVVAGTQKMNMAIMQTGYVMNDAQMFLVNFRMGMMGISNNIPMIINLFRQSAVEAKSMGVSIKDVLIKSLTGAGGLMLALNSVMFLLQVLPDLFSGTTQSIEDQKKAVDELRDAYTKLTKAELENRLTTYQTQLSELESQHPNKTIGRTFTTAAGTIETTSQRKLTPEERFGDDLARVNSLNQQIDLLKELIRDRGIEEDKIKQIAQWREKIELMNNNPDSKNYWKNLVNDATSYEDAVKKLNNAIEQYQKKTEKPKKPKEEKIPTAEELFVKEMEQILPSSIFEALQPLAQEEPQALPDVKLLSEQELQKLKINNIEDKFAREKELADWELQNELLKYQNFANYEEIRTELEKQHSIKRKEIANEEANFKIATYLQTLDLLKGAFAEHTAIAKAASIASTIIQTYQAATAALSPPPIGAGPLLGPILAAATIAAGMANVAKMTSIKIPGFALGGRLPKGESGFIEGYNNEIIAPEKTFVEIFRQELRPQIYNNAAVNYDLSGIKESINKLNIALEKGIIARAYLDDREARKITAKGNYLNNKSKL